jgi:hypothetical protein
MNDIKISQTWAGKTEFNYFGSVAEGTTIPIYKGKVFIHTSDYESLLDHFRGCTVDLGTSFNPSGGSIGEWLKLNVLTKAKIASYIGAILIAEGYAERVGQSGIKIF